MNYVYLLKSSLNNEIFYVGKGSGNRMYKHIQFAKRCSDFRNSKNPHLYAKICKILKSGGKIIYEKIFETTDELEAYQYEKKIISDIGLNKLTNIADGGLGGMIGKWTDERKLKASESAKHRWSKIKPDDRKLSESTKNKIGASVKNNSSRYWKGKTLSEETKAKMSKAKKGKTFTDEHRKNISNALKNNNT